ncbi:MAG: SDR family oxidoreductase [Spirochaetales bacterium]|nr:SDR family oxidoreductase [Spirochaetales bacterium]
MTGKTALITGGAKRLGRAITRGLVNKGVNVIVHYNESAKEAEQLVAEAKSAGVKAWAVKADLLDKTGVEGLFEKAEKASGSVEILINNASIFPEESLLDFSYDSLIQNVDIHAYAPLCLSRHFSGSKKGGDIINILDSRITDYDDRHVAYHLSKRMLYSLTRLMALEFAPFIRVNAVAPGLILPPPGKGEEYLKEQAHSNPLQTHGEPKDVSQAVNFLIENRFITGQVIFVDGGRHLKGSVYGS